METCCICDRDLPNRYSVAGRCESGACGRPFCALHWNRSNRLCRAHGYRETEPSKPARKPSKESPMNAADDATVPEEAPIRKKFDAARVKAALLAAVEGAKKLGAGAAGLYRRLLKIKSPQEMLREVEDAATANQARSADLSARMEKLFNDVAAKKKAWTSAPPARKRILEAELKTMLATYNSAEREYKVLLENERVLAQVRGRMLEVTAYDMAGVSEERIDRLIDEIEEKVQAAEGRVDAARDLDKAGTRRERESDRESFEDQLAQFDAEAAAAEVEPALPAPDTPPRAKAESEKPEG